MTYGCKEPKLDIRDYKIKAGAAIQFPEEFQLEHPRVKNQRDVNSCVAHATSSILEYFTKGSVKLSTDFIYGMERSVCGEEEPGMYLVDACKIVKEYGDMLEQSCPGNTEVPICSDKVEALTKKANSALEVARLFKISSYYTCTCDNDVKYALMHYGPVLACIYWYNNFEVVNKNGLIDIKKDNPSLDGGYHAIMIYGWNKDGFLIQNSWGEEFANHGCFILPYKYPIAEAKVLIDVDNPDEIDKLIKPAGITKFKVVYKPINFILNLFKKKKK